MGKGKPQKLQEYQGFRVGDRVKLKIVAVPEDHTAVISSFNARGQFKVLLKSPKYREANGQWGPVDVTELQKVG